jgi:DNA-directed RNA polymerase specialized sigma24 family protein
MASPGYDADMIALDGALNRLADFDPKPANIVKLRFFGSLDMAETAEAMGISSRTVKRERLIAKLWLLREMNRGRQP